MKKMNNILAVSMIAMLSVTAANAKIVSESMLQSSIIAGNDTVTVTVPEEGQTNAGKIVISGPTLPTVNDATLTIKQGGANAQTFTANAASGTEIDITPAKVGAVPTTRTVAGHALSADVTLSKSDVGLGNVDNTSDANKPISTATQTALNAKQDKSNMVDAENVLSAVQNESKYPSVPATLALVQSELDTRQSGYTSKGSATVPVYFDEYGVANEIESYSGNAATATNVAWSGVTGKPDASTTTKGIIQIATDSDVSTGTNTTKAVTPAQLKTVASDATDAVKTVKVNNAALTETNGAVDITITEGTGDGTIKVNGSDVSVHGLKSGAYANAYSLPTAASDTLGGVKIGTDIAIASGVISVDKATTVASGNEKPVTSGAVYSELQNKQNTLSSGTNGNVTITNNNSVTSSTGVVKSVTAENGAVAVSRGTVGTNDIAGDAVTSAKIADATIVNADIANNTIESVKIVDLAKAKDAVTGNKDGQYVLTAKITTSGDTKTVTYYWEDIGRN